MIAVGDGGGESWTELGGGVKKHDNANAIFQIKTRRRVSPDG